MTSICEDRASHMRVAQGTCALSCTLCVYCGSFTGVQNLCLQNIILHNTYTSGVSGSGSSSSWEKEGNDTQVVSSDIMDDLAEKFRLANASIDLEGQQEDEPELAPSLQAASPACV